MTTRTPIQCLFCTHWISPLDDPARAEVDDPPQICAAFDRIPDEIWDGHADHRKPFPGDRGIQWSALDGETFPESALM